MEPIYIVLGFCLSFGLGLWVDNISRTRQSMKSAIGRLIVALVTGPFLAIILLLFPEDLNER